MKLQPAQLRHLALPLRFTGKMRSDMSKLPLSTELLGLIGAAALGLVHIVLASHAVSLQRGYRWTAGPRDEVMPPLSGVPGRLARASANYLETFPYFAAGLLAVLITNSQSSWSRWGVWLYLFGRVIYLPLYAAGVVLVRSLAWNVATAGIAAIYIAICV
jgi:uncharacterized MAPEG superfamily protein